MATVVLVAIAALAMPAQGQLFQRSAIVIENARIVTGDGTVIEDGMIILRGDTIGGVGRDLNVRGRADRIDAEGRTITPGLIDVDSGLGLGGATAGNARRRAWDGFDRYATATLEEAWRNGVTTVYLSARGGAGVGGTDAIVRLSRERGTAIGTAQAEDAALTVDLRSGDTATARLRTLDGLRRTFQRAEDYRESLETYEDELEEYEKKIAERAKKEEEKEGDGEGEGEKNEGEGGGGDAKPEEKKEEEIKKPRQPSPDRSSEVLLQAIDNELHVRMIADRAADILNALDLAEAFGLDVTIVGGAEAHLVADELADADVDVILTMADEAGTFRDDARHRRSHDTPAALDDAGVAWALGSGGASSRSRFILLAAQRALRNGAADPVEALTSRAASMLGIDEELGTLRPGMLADLVIWTDDPSSPGARVAEVWVAGRRVYEEDDE